MIRRIISISGVVHFGRLALCLTLLAALPITSKAQGFQTLDFFTGPNGINPSGALVQAADGYLYGTTLGGGAQGGGGAGTVFKVSPGGSVATIYTFDGIHGGGPGGALIQIGNGDLYGTARSGGANGYGVIFKITPAGALTVLYSFTNTADGEDPEAGFVRGLDGNLYSTTNFGGSYGFGTVFRITPDGTFTTVYSFDGTEGTFPDYGLILATDGNFYGTTLQGGTSGSGTIFKLTPSGQMTTLYNFTGTTDGGTPAVLLEGPGREIYGTTLASSPGKGTIFKITLKGQLTTLHTFDGDDGNEPGSLVVGSDGNIYGVAYGGGSFGPGFPGVGTIFEITPAGAFTLLHTFCISGPGESCNDGAGPVGLMQDTNGIFYGTTEGGGLIGESVPAQGTIFEVTGLGAFVKAEPGAGVPGEIVRILGTNLTGTTSVTFDGTSAPFAVLSDSFLLARVPRGAKSGIIQVVTPFGTVSSAVKFGVF